MRDSSLSASTQAVVAAETGHLDLAYDYCAEAALIDLEQPGGNSEHGAAHRLAGGHLERRRRRVRRHRVRLHRAGVRPGSCRRGAEQDLVRAGLAGSQLRVSITADEAEYGWSVGRRCGCATTASRWRWPTPRWCARCRSRHWSTPSSSRTARPAGPAPGRLRGGEGLAGGAHGIRPAACLLRTRRKDPVNLDHARALLTAELEELGDRAEFAASSAAESASGDLAANEAGTTQTRPTSAPKSRTGWRARASSGPSSCSGRRVQDALAARRGHLRPVRRVRRGDRRRAPRGAPGGRHLPRARRRPGRQGRLGAPAATRCGKGHLHVTTRHEGGLRCHPEVVHRPSRGVRPARDRGR